ncbi:MAG: glycosyltransferase family 4 protein [Pseudomonadota bacterium]|nr:glycosyltransferase family 4 protein [Pseudomonadota bacterium]
MKKFFFIIPNFNKTLTGGNLYDFNLYRELKNKHIPIKKIFINIKKKHTNLKIFSQISNLPIGSTLCIDGLLVPYLKNNINIFCEKFDIILLIHHPTTQENSSYPLMNLKDYFLERIIFNKKLKIVTVSNYIKKELRKYLNKYKEIYVAEPGIEKIFFSKYAQKNTNNILSIGNVIPRKGYHILIEALSKVPGDWSLHIIGDFTLNQEYYEELISKIRKFNLNKKVKFLGVIEKEKMLEYMRNSKIFVLPTLFEGYGMSLLEAAIMGIKVITTDLPVLRESLKGKNVQFIDHCKINNFSKAIEESLKQKPLSNKTIDKNIYSWKQTRKKFLEAINAKK